jgi:peroxiredoxin Q/BCP
MLDEGVAAPDFTLVDQEGGTVKLSDFRGQWIVLWWYPEAKTEGCTIEGRSFQALYAEFQKAGANVVGASFNKPDKNLDFAECESFSFPLLSDHDRVAGSAYEVVRKPDEKFADKPRRVTYLISPDARIQKAYLVTEVHSHASQVLQDLREQQANAGKL